MLEYIIAAVLLSGVIGLSGGILLLFSKKNAMKCTPYLVSYAAGALLSAAFLGLIPEMVGMSTSQTAFSSILGGIVIFYILERFFSWYHHHGRGKLPTFSYMIILGDTLHNFIDGVIIAATFIADFALGVTTTLAVLLHEIPQEIGDFGVLLHARMKKSRVIMYNLVSALFAVVGALVAYRYLMVAQGMLPFVIGIAAGGFIYIAGTDLIPETYKGKGFDKAVLHTLIFLVGILTILLAGSLV